MLESRRTKVGILYRVDARLLDREPIRRDLIVNLGNYVASAAAGGLDLGTFWRQLKALGIAPSHFCMTTV
jgi:hypothetical protein